MVLQIKMIGNFFKTRQPIFATNLNQFKDVTRLFYSNKQVAEYNYTKLKELSHPVATIQARHSTHTAKRISPQDLFGLEPFLLLAKGSVVMLTMNLWAYMLHIIVKKINSFHLNLYLTSDAQDSSSDTTSPVASLSGTSSNTNSKNLLQCFS